ncbi:SSI family serine proteinase inhibitor [Streptomyces sp. NPDC058657]|uniref:SSI family serine proteinase inhibitor n=1 Tax=unclassified Streptomyces TaxID=2593676 RepID=UPI00365E14AA
MPGRFATAVLPLLAVLGTVSPAGPPADSGGGGEDRLTLTVARTGVPGRDGTYELRCHPSGGSHREPGRACAHLDGATVWGRGPFAPVPPDSVCTGQYGGPATAHVTGTWAGRPVDARFSRTDGCEMARWDALVPFLPATAGAYAGPVM